MGDALDQLVADIRKVKLYYLLFAQPVSKFSIKALFYLGDYWNAHLSQGCCIALLFVLVVHRYHKQPLAQIQCFSRGLKSSPRKQAL